MDSIYWISDCFIFGIYFLSNQKSSNQNSEIPVSPDESEIIRRVESTDPAFLMPLPESNLPQLTPEEIAVFKQWIKEGAKYEKHW